MAGMPASGHLNPSLPLVRELVRRGIEVTYCTGTEFRDAVERTGAEFVGYPDGSLSAADIAAATRTGSSVAVVNRILTATESLLPFVLDQVREGPTDAVLHDSNALWGRMAAASLRLPTISFMTTFLVGTANVRVMNGREWRTSITPMLRDIPATFAQRRRLARRFGKQLFPPAPMLPMRGDLSIFPVPRELQSPDPRIDGSCHFIGPTIDPDIQQGQLDAELAAHVTGPEPVVLVSLGTLHAGSLDFFHACFDVLADLPARVLLAVGSHLDPAALGTPPANTLVRQTVPQLEVLRHTAAFVTHGGMNSAMEGLSFGVPLVVVPQQVEQLIIGKVVEDRGAALVLRHNVSRRAVPPAELRTAVEHALTDPAMRTAAKTMSTTLTTGGGAPAGADAVQRLLTP